jgi:hypothetical protein
MEEKDLADWQAFENELEGLRARYKNSPSRLLFRGVSDSNYPLTTTLERKGFENMSFHDYYQLTAGIKPAVETLTGVQWEVPEYDEHPERSFRDSTALIPHPFPTTSYPYLVYLRHNGFPSPLLDWSSSPYVAAFFAFRDPIAKPKWRSIYVFCEMTRPVKAVAAGGPTIRQMGPYVRSHPRHFRQQADYTVCEKYDSGAGWSFCPHVFGSDDRQDLLWKFNIPSTECVTVLRSLDEHNLNAYSLFDSEETLLETMWFREKILTSY